MDEPKRKKFIFILESTEEPRRLDIDDSEIIVNADGEVDVPLDRVLRRYHLNYHDLCQMNVKQVAFAEEDELEQRTLRSISFENLHHT